MLGEPVARPEAPERTVVAPDARGYGGSSDADGPFGSPMTSSGCWTPSRSIELSWRASPDPSLEGRYTTSRDLIGRSGVALYGG